MTVVNVFISLHIIDGGLKDAMTLYLKSNPNIKAVILGTRSTDPGNEHVGSFAPSDGDWPSMMRVNPIINWKYSDVWTFIRGLTILYPGMAERPFFSEAKKIPPSSHGFGCLHSPTFLFWWAVFAPSVGRKLDQNNYVRITRAVLLLTKIIKISIL